MSNGAARKRARNRRAREAVAHGQAQQQDQELRRVQRPLPPDWWLADEGYNRHVVFWEAGELRANFEAEDESEGWVSLTRGDGRCMWYHPKTRVAFWTGFEPVVEFFVRDIEQYIHAKFYQP